MALLKAVNTVVFEEELVFPSAYHKIVTVEGNKGQINIQVTTYKDESKEIFLQSKNYSFVPDNNDNALRWDKQGYEYLKTLPEFANAIDC